MSNHLNGLVKSYTCLVTVFDVIFQFRFNLLLCFASPRLFSGGLFFFVVAIT